MGKGGQAKHQPAQIGLVWSLMSLTPYFSAVRGRPAFTFETVSTVFSGSEPAKFSHRLRPSGEIGWRRGNR